MLRNIYALQVYKIILKFHENYEIHLNQKFCTGELEFEYLISDLRAKPSCYDPIQ